MRIFANLNRHLRARGGKTLLFLSVLFLTSVSLLLALLAASCGEDDAKTEVITLTANLDGEGTIPPPVDSAWGIFTMEVEVTTPEKAQQDTVVGDAPGGYVISYVLSLSNAENVTGAYLHQASLQEDGPVVYTLWEGAMENEFFNGTLTEGDFLEQNFEGPLAGKDFGAFVGSLLADRIYVRVEVENHENGELREQLEIPPDRRTLFPDYAY